MNRNQILNEVLKKLDLELNEFDLSLNEIVSDLSNETKSSAGDKYETAREMIQQERDQLETARKNKMQQRTLIGQIFEFEVQKKVQSGSIVKTNHGLYLLGAPIGKIALTNNEILFALGLTAPLSQKLLGKELKDSVELNGRTYIIEDLC